nr:AAA family ATPase [Nocardioidaceae bacterium]
MSARPDAPSQPELDRERRHLATSRVALSRMRARVAGLTAHAGDPVSTEHLRAALWHRMRALEDDPEVPLFFGRLDTTGDAEQPAERLYVGRRHVTDEHGDPLVLDWRARVCRAFYRANPRAPMGVRLRRRFGFQHGRLTAYEDEPLHRTDAAPGSSAILVDEIERPRLGPMRDIVATIQPDQDEIVRASLASTVCVQGAPGTGKTAVGLHRAAYLLYAHRDQLSRQGVLVVGPNSSFLRYIGDVLPALGEIDARQTTVEQLCGRVHIRAVDGPAAGRLKGDSRLAEMVRRAVWAQLRVPDEPLVVPRGARRWRVPAHVSEPIVAELRGRGVRYGAGRALLPQRMAHAVLVRMEEAGESPDDRVQDAVARSRPMRAWCDQVWPRVDPVRLVFWLLSRPDLLAEAADGVLDDDERRLLAWPTRPRSPGAARWTLADAVLVDEVADLVERVPSLGHVVLDEAQDLSPMMLRCVGRQCSTGSATVLGDVAQATTPWGVQSWAEALSHLGKPRAHVEELTVGFRVPGEVIDYAARLLPTIAPHLRKPTSVRRSRGELRIEETAVPLDAAVSHVVQALGLLGSIGLIVPDPLALEAAAALTRRGVAHSVLGQPDRVDSVDIETRVDLVPARLVKGLEFDHVVLVEPAAIVDGEADEVTGLRRLYVCLTRAVTSLVVVHE